MRIAKAIVTAIGGLATVLSGALADNVLGTGEVGSFAAALAVAVVTVYGVWRVPNRAE